MNVNKEEDLEMDIGNLLEKMEIIHGEDLSTSILRRVRIISPKLSPLLKFSKPEKLIPIVIYLELRLLNIPFDKRSLIKHSSLTCQELNHFILQFITLIPFFR